MFVSFYLTFFKGKNHNILIPLSQYQAFYFLEHIKSWKHERICWLAIIGQDWDSLFANMQW